MKAEEARMLRLLLISRLGLLDRAFAVTAYVPFPIVRLLFKTKEPEPNVYVGEFSPEG